MPQALPLPDGSFVTIRQGETPQQTWARAIQMYPEAFGFEKSEEKKDYGFGSAFSAGLSRIAGEAGLTAGKAGLISPEKAEAYYRAQEEKAAKIHRDTQEGWLESPWQKLKETAGTSAAYMLGPAAAGLGALAAPAAIPAGALGAGLAGLVSTGQFTGSNLARQMEEGKTLEETSGAAAVGAAIPQAALDVVSLRMMPGVGRLFGQAGVKLSQVEAKKFADEGLKKAIWDYAKATGKTMGVESLTEAGQQVLERLQAGLAIDDEKARAEYLENAIGGAALAAVLGPFGRAYERGRIKKEAKQLDQIGRETAVMPPQPYQTTEGYETSQAPAYTPAQGELFPTEGQPAGTAPGYMQQDGRWMEQPAPTPQEEQPTHFDLLRQKSLLEQTIDDHIKAVNAATTFEDRVAAGRKVVEAKRALAEIEAQLPKLPPDVLKQKTLLMQAINERVREAEEATEPKEKAAAERKVIEAKRALAEFEARAKRDAHVAAVEGNEEKLNAVQARQEQLGLFGEAPMQAQADFTEGQLQATEETARLSEEANARRAQLAEEIKGLQRLKERATGPEYARLAAEERRLTLEWEKYAPTSLSAQAQSGVTEQGTLFGPEQVSRIAAPSTEGVGFVQRLLGQLRGAQVDDNTRQLLDRLEDISLPAQNLPGAANAAQIEEELASIREQRKKGTNDAQRLQQIAALDTRRKQLEARLQALNEARDRLGVLTKEQAQGFMRGEASLEQALQNLREEKETLLRSAEPAQQGLLHQRELMLEQQLARISQQPLLEKLEAGQSKPAAVIGDWLQSLAEGREDPNARRDVESFLQQLEGAQETGTQPVMEEARRLTTPQEELLTGEPTTPEMRETEEVAAPQQQELFGAGEQGAAATAFDSAEKFQQYLAGKGVDLLRRSMGPVRETSSRLMQRLKAVRDSAAKLKALFTAQAEQKTRQKADVEFAEQEVESKRSALQDVERDLTNQLMGLRLQYMSAHSALVKARETAAGLMDMAIASVEAMRTAVAEDARMTPVVRQRLVEMHDELRTALTALKAARADEAIARADAAIGQVGQNELTAVETISPEVVKKLQLAQMAQTRVLTAQKAITGLKKQLKGLDVSASDINNFLTQDAELQAMIRAQQSRIGGLMRAKSTAHDALVKAFRSQRHKPEVIARINAAKSDLELAEALLDFAVSPEEKARIDAMFSDVDLTNLQDLNRYIRELTQAVDANMRASEARNAREVPSRLYAAGMAQRGEERKAEQAAEIARKEEEEKKKVQTRKISFEARHEKTTGILESKKAKAAEQTLITADKDSEEYKEAEAYLQSLQDRLAENDKKAKALEAEISDLVARREADVEAAKEDPEYQLSPSFLKRYPLDRVELARRHKNNVAKIKAQFEANTKRHESAKANKAKALDKRIDTILNGTKDKNGYNQQIENLRRQLLKLRGEATVVSNQLQWAEAPAAKAKREADAAKREEEIARIAKTQTQGRTEQVTKSTTIPAKTLKTQGLTRTSEGELREKTEEEVHEGGTPRGKQARVAPEGVIRTDEQVWRETAIRILVDETDFNSRELKAKTTGELAALAAEVGERKRVDAEAEVEAAEKIAKELRKARDARLEELAKSKAREDKAALKRLQADLEELADIRRAEGEGGPAIEQEYDEEVVKEELAEIAARRAARRATRKGKQKQAASAENITPSTVSVEGAQATTWAKEKPVVIESEAAKRAREAEDEASELRGDQTFYEARESTPLKGKVLAAVKEGRLVDALQMLAESAADPETRETAKRLLPMVQNTTLTTEDNVTLDGKPVAAKFTANKNAIVLDNAHLTEEELVHEVGHAATDGVLKADPNTLTQEQREAREDLEDLYNRAKKDAAFGKEYGTVSLPEFISELLSNRALRNKIDRMGGLLNRIYNALARLLGLRTTSQKALENAYKIFTPSQARVGTDVEAGVASALRGVFPSTSPVFSLNLPEGARKLIGNTTSTQSLGQKISAYASGMYWRTQTADRWAAPEELGRRGVEEGKLTEARLLQARLHMRLHEQAGEYTGAALINGVPSVRMREGDKAYVVEGGDPQVSVRRISEILNGVADAVGNQQAVEHMFTTWMAILRGEQVGFDKLNYTTQPSAAQIAELKAAVDSNPKIKDAFAEARKVYGQYNKNLMNLMVQSGRLSKEVADELTAGDYIPYYRLEPRTGNLLISTGGKPVRIGNVIDQPQLKELVGGEGHILPIFEGAVQNTSMLMRMSLQNLQTRDISYMFQELKLGVIKSGEGPAGAVRFYQNGENYWLELDRDAFPKDIPADVVVLGMQGIKTAMPALVKAMAIPANILRKTVRRMPIYTLRQTLRDPMHAWMTTGGDFAPIISSWKEMAKGMRGQSDTQLTLKQAGVISSHIFSGDPESTAHMLREITGGKGNLSKALMALDNLAMQGEASTRAVLYDKFRRQGLSHSEALLHTLETMNFSRRGTSASLHWLGTMIPFFNAQIQGIDSLWRTVTGKTVFQEKMDVRADLLKKGAMMAAMTMAYAMMMQDDEAYKNATPEERANSWFLRVPGLDEPLRVPIPFEIGLVFKTIPELVVNTAWGDTKAKDAMAALGKAVMMSQPIGLPTAIKGPIELWANRSFYSGQPIETQHEQAMTTDQRYRQSTTEVSKMLGKMGIASPVQMDYLIRTYTGSMGILLASMVNPVLRPLSGAEEVSKPEQRLSEMAVFGPLFQPNTGRGLVNAAYDDIRTIQQASSTFKAMLKEGRRADAEAFAQKFSREIALASTGGAFRQQMGELAQLKRNIAASKDLTPVEKRDQIDKIKRVEIAYASRVHAMLD